MQVNIFTLFISIVSLIWSAQHLIIGASGIAQRYRIPPLLIGLTLVALGSSLPDIIAAITASIEGQSDPALSHAVGANIANIGLVLGVTALLNPRQPGSALLRREYPILFVVMLFMYLLIIDGQLSTIDGILMLIGFTLLLSYLFYAAHHPYSALYSKHFYHSNKTSPSLFANITNTLLGIIVLSVSEKFLIKSATDIASNLGDHQEILNFSIIAITSNVPVVITSLVASFRGQNDLAIGNILGSNMLNLLTVLILPGILHYSPVSTALLSRDIPAMLFITALLFAINHKHSHSINRFYGGLLILIYICYMVAIIMNAAG